MGKKSKKLSTSASSTANQNSIGPPAAFPTTRLSILEHAEAGDWQRFYDHYLVASARETAFACRARGIPLQDVDDLIQDLVIRLQQNGGFAKQWREKLRSVKADLEFRGNIPAKYLYARQFMLSSAKFRTYLKAVIKRLVLEHVRKRKAVPRGFDQLEATMRGVLDESIDLSIDRNMVIACAGKAAQALAKESLEATTKGKKRQFAALYFSVVGRWSLDELAKQFRIDRTSAAHLLKAARQRFVMLIEEATGITDRDFLRRSLLRDPAALVRAFEDARRTTEGRAARRYPLL